MSLKDCLYYSMKHKFYNTKNISNVHFPVIFTSITFCSREPLHTINKYGWFYICIQNEHLNYLIGWWKLQTDCTNHINNFYIQETEKVRIL